ncbi:hypothetical protein QR680_007454 [Steinernema hermaphroditum]|uniref:Uncharacterized protein n=1 Tax=Steinernema hermaphroditum TaxID=289476 RepID=A0AA39M6F3_9BILA|nr:hypothetical protein QR680_007454 [Steinernema hermaphroditum]
MRQQQQQNNAQLPTLPNQRKNNIDTPNRCRCVRFKGTTPWCRPADDVLAIFVRHKKKRSGPPSWKATPNKKDALGVVLNYSFGGASNFSVRAQIWLKKRRNAPIWDMAAAVALRAFEQVNAGVELPDTGLHSDLEKMNNTRRDSTIETRWRAYEGIPDGSGSLGMWKKQVREIQSALNPIRRFGSGPFPDPHYGDMEPNPLP